jgi:hypothetical protein
MATLKEHSCSAPIILEIGIGRDRDISENMRNAVLARDELVTLWEGC